MNSLVGMARVLTSFDSVMDALIARLEKMKMDVVSFAYVLQSNSGGSLHVCHMQDWMPALHAPYYLDRL